MFSFLSILKEVNHFGHALDKIKKQKQKQNKTTQLFPLKILSTKIYNFENLQNVHNGTENESDVTKN